MDARSQARLNRLRRLERVRSGRDRRGGSSNRNGCLSSREFVMLHQEHSEFMHPVVSDDRMHIDNIGSDNNAYVSQTFHANSSASIQPMVHVTVHSNVNNDGIIETVSRETSVIENALPYVSRKSNLAVSSWGASTSAVPFDFSDSCLVDVPVLAAEADIEFNDVGTEVQVHPVPEEFLGSSHERTCFQPFRFGPPSAHCPFCDALLWPEERVNPGKRSSNPTFSLCCQEGIVKLPPFKPTPPFLADLLDYGRGGQASRFRDGIRVFNSMFQISSMGARVDSSVNNTPGPYVFRINGQNHHRIGSLLPIEGSRPRFAQLYVYDTINEDVNRLGIFGDGQMDDSVHPSVVQGLRRMLDEQNEIVKVFRMARDRCASSPDVPVRLRLIGSGDRGNGTYNQPTGSEVAVLVVGDLGQSDTRDIVVEHRSEGLKRISELHRLFMPMQYPLLFPYGDPGFSVDIPYVQSPKKTRPRRKFVTMREYYSYIIQMRSLESNTLLRGGRLFQQFLADAYAAVEENRLKYIRENQQALRTELYKGLRDAVHRGDRDANSVGKRVILPASFTGSPRYLFQNYQDAMAICRSFGFPDLFITFTCNARWTEIQGALIPGQRAEDRPDVVSRVFRLKLRYLMEDLTKNMHFGTVVAATYTVEFQKRGLPHTHILLWLHPDDRCKTAADVDRIISAEIPDKQADRIGYDMVSQFMIHGPCGVGNRSAPCVKDGKCSKYFPRSFQPETMISDEGFPVYRRRDVRDARHTVMKSGIEVDNRYVVPHNVDLLVKYEAHINVELCSKTRAVKYLFKYINKGPDRVRAVVESASRRRNNQNRREVEEDDETRIFVDCRYLSAYEACWRLFAFDIHLRDPAVERLVVHLPDEQTVCFSEQQSLASVINRENIRNTMFVEWMRTNREHEDARNLLYIDFPTQWVWSPRQAAWTRRKQGRTIGRINYVHPAAGELYYLRMAVTKIKGATCYEDLRTVNGVVFPTFQQACEAMGLLGDDNEWTEAMLQASEWASSKQLRQLFMMIIMYCQVTNPSRLWENVWHLMSDDIEHRVRIAFGSLTYQIPRNELQNYVLVSLEQLFNKNYSSLAHFKLPLPTQTSLYLSSNRLIQEELNYNLTELQQDHLDCLQRLNQEQLEVYHAVKNSVDHGEGGMFFVHGHGGTGKTFLWKTIISAIRSASKIVLAVASSGIASLLLPGGRTAHSRFKIPIDVSQSSTCEIRKNTQLASLVECCSLIVWDEAPMVHRNCFEALDRSLRDIMSGRSSTARDQPFGGKIVLLGGDFRQILPVIEGGSREQIINATICQSSLWKYCKVYTLKINMRLLTGRIPTSDISAIQIFDQWLLDIGDGKIRTVSHGTEEEPSWINIPHDLLLQSSGDSIATIVAAVYENFERNYTESSYIHERAIVTAYNETVHLINEHVLELIPQEMGTYYSCDSISDGGRNAEENQMLYSTEFLNSLRLPGIADHELNLKVGAAVMVLRNIDQSVGLCNGTRLIITQLAANVIEGKIISGAHKDERVFIPRISLVVKNQKWPFIFTRRQFPLKLCYGMTINKSQGQTLNSVGLYLPRTVFTHGQLYVALSRVTSRSGLKILIENKSDQPQDQTRNIVYSKIFESLISGLENGIYIYWNH